MKRWSSAWGLTGTPSRALVWLNSSRVAAGLASHPNTKVRTKTLPVSFDRRRAKPLAPAAASAAPVSTARSARATSGIVAIGGSLR